MKKKKIDWSRLLSSLGILIIPIVIFIAINRWEQGKVDKIVSCSNHEKFLRAPISEYIAEHNEFPYGKDQPGYLFFSKFTSQKSVSLNCNHAAPNSLIGGWQYVNLSPDTWGKVFEKWNPNYGEYIPFYWCGRKSGLKSRVSSVILYNNGSPKIQFEHHNLKEDELQRAVYFLNIILKELGGKAISPDIPNNVQWKMDN